MKSLAALALSLSMIFFLSACANPEKISEDKADDQTYAVAFEAMNSQRSHELSLNKGDSLAVMIEMSRGKIKLTICGEGGEELYAGNLSDSFEFAVGVPADGTYTVTVNGEHAFGVVSVSAVPE